MKYLKLFEIDKKILPKYEVGNYVLCNDPDRQIYYEILRVDKVDYIGHGDFSYICAIPNDFGDYDKGLRIGFLSYCNHMIRKAEDWELNAIKYNL